MKVNQQQIADQLNVSRVTVTKALKDDPDISPQTRQKVKDMAKTMGYIPNGIGRSLATQKTHTIGIIVPKINHSFFSSAVEHMCAAASRLGFQIILMVTFEDADREFTAIKTLLSMNVGGILIDTAVSSSDDEPFALINRRKVPLLFFDRKLRHITTSGVFFKDYQLSFQLATELVDRGFTKFVYITGEQHINNNYERRRGFTEGLHSRNLNIPDQWVLTANLQEEEGYQTFRTFVSVTKNLPQVVVCVNDSVALGVYRACKEANISIPDQLSVVGFGNLLISGLVDPPLSTVDLMIEEASKQAIKNLVQLIEGSAPSDAVPDTFFSGKILLRESVRSSNLP